MSASYGQIEERIKQTINDLRTQSKPNIATTARKFDVPLQRLQIDLKETHPRLSPENKIKTFRSSRKGDLSVP